MTRVLPTSKIIPKWWLPIALVLGLPVVILAATALTRTKPLNFVGDFETKNTSGWKPDLCCIHSGEIVNSPVRGGNYAIKFTLNRSDPMVKNGNRAELKRRDIAPMGSEYWYGFSIYLPNDWVEDTAPEIVTQWHDIPDFWIGESWKQPSLTLSINNKNWGIGNTWDSKLVTKQKDVEGKEVLWSGGFVKGVWTDWVFRVRWSHKSDGIVEVWKDGVRIISKRGPNTYNDTLAPYLKVGSYKYTWKKNKITSLVDQRVVYFDEVRIGNASANYSDVAPKGSVAGR